MAVEEKREDFKGRSCEKIKRPQQETQEPKRGRQNNSGFPPNVTVDELWIYRKRRPAFTWPKDNLKLEEGEFKSLKTEYKRRFKNFYNAINKSLSEKEDSLRRVQLSKPHISLKLEGLHDFHSEYNESFAAHPMEGLAPPSKCLQGMDDEISTGQLPGPNPTSQTNNPLDIVRPRLLKRPTNLKIEGDFSHVTEHAEKFIEYLIGKRSELLRTSTTLRLEGEMDTKTENREQFIRYDITERPPLCKKFTNLHLEGSREGMTEQQDKFLPFELTRRPPLIKKSTNLNLEGDLTLIPEYRRQYIDYKTLERPSLVLPSNNLKLGGLFESLSDEINSRDRKMHPLIPFLREPDKKFDDTGEHRKTPRRSSRSGEDNDSRIASKTHLNIVDCSKSKSHPNLYDTKTHDVGLAGNVDTNPEYKNSHIDFSKQNVKGRRHSGLNYMGGDCKMETQPEYSSSYVNFPRQRPHIRKPEGHICNEGELYHLTEKNEKYVPHNFFEKTEPCKREPELKLEGRFQCQPEYRKAYIDYLIRERKPETQKRRAFELVSKDNELSDHTSQDNISDVQLIPSNENGVPSNNKLESSKPNLNGPNSKVSSSDTSSMASTPKSTTKAPQLRKLSQIEASAFGPRCIQSKVRGSLTPSPVPHFGRDRNSQVRSRDSSPKLITKSSLVPQRKANLPHAPTIKEMSSSECDGPWTESVDTDTAFYVLDERAPTKRIATNNLYKEQKWMPSWNYSNE